MVMRFHLLSCVNEDDLEQLKMLLKQENYILFEINGMRVKDADSFFDQAIQILPLDPPLSGGVHWDAFSDSLWGGIDSLAVQRVALLWTSAHNMLSGSLPDLLSAVDTICGVARNVYDTSTGISTRTELLLFLVGKGPNFRRLNEEPIF